MPLGCDPSCTDRPCTCPCPASFVGGCAQTARVRVRGRVPSVHSSVPRDCSTALRAHAPPSSPPSRSSLRASSLSFAWPSAPRRGSAPRSTQVAASAGVSTAADLRAAPCTSRYRIERSPSSSARRLRCAGESTHVNASASYVARLSRALLAARHARERKLHCERLVDFSQRAVRALGSQSAAACFSRAPRLPRP